jgi:predicted transposase YbfD/YdcC
VRHHRDLLTHLCSTKQWHDALDEAVRMHWHSTELINFIVNKGMG